VNDLRFAFRQLLKNPGLTAVAVFTLALGIGVNLGLFALLNDLFLKPKPLLRPDELWTIQSADARGQQIYANISRPFYEAFRAHALLTNRVIAYAPIYPKLRTRDGWEMVAAELVSGDYFRLLGVRLVLGRDFLPEEDDKPGTHNVVVVSHEFWRKHLESTSDLAGRTITVNGIIADVVGVAPPEFGGLNVVAPQIWLPTSMEFVLDQFTTYRPVVRIADRRSVSVIQDALAPLVQDTSKALSGFNDPRWSRYGWAPEFKQVKLQPAGRGVLAAHWNPEGVSTSLALAYAATGLVLLIAAANVANLLLARALRRRKEMATRLAIGASRWVLVRQLMIEGVLLAALGSVGSLLVLNALGGFMASAIPPTLIPSARIVPDWRVVGVAFLAAFAVGAGFSLLPALQATRFDTFAALKDAGSGERATGRVRLRSLLVVVQIAASLLLVSCATLCVRSLQKQLAVDVGFDTDHLAVAYVDLEKVGYTTNTAPPLLEALLQRFAVLPGVEAVGMNTGKFFQGFERSMGIPFLDGYDAKGKEITFEFSGIGPGSFGALGVPVRQGRDVSGADLQSTRRLAVVNESFVRKFWPDQQPVGKEILDWEVIGVVRDARLNSPGEPAGPKVFVKVQPTETLRPTFIVRTRGHPRSALADLRTELARVHPLLTGSEIITMREAMRHGLAAARTVQNLFTALTVMALVLAMVGAFGVISFLVSQRRREIGIRFALGATKGQVTGLFLGAGLRLAVIGVVAGLPLALGMSWLLRARFFGLNPFDPASFMISALFVVGVASLACWLPARRAAKVDPMEALRHE